MASRPDVWTLDQIAQRYRQLPDTVLELREAGFSSTARYAFNRAVFTLASRIERQSQETVEEMVPEPSKPPKGMTRSRRPKWSLAELLYDRSEETESDEGGVLPEFENLPAALL